MDRLSLRQYKDVASVRRKKADIAVLIWRNGVRAQGEDCEEKEFADR
jgi:hypothetical protein